METYLPDRAVKIVNASVSGSFSELQPRETARMTRSKSSSSRLPVTPSNSVVGRIFRLRGGNILLDSDLGGLYGIETRVLLQAVKRNAARFPSDFMFQLTNQELANLRSQSVISSWGGRRHLPFAFTEQGVAMLSSVLASPRAIAVNIEIMRTFVRLREVLGSNKALAEKLDLLEKRIDNHDAEIATILDAIRQLIKPAVVTKPPIGFIR